MIDNRRYSLFILFTVILFASFSVSADENLYQKIITIEDPNERSVFVEALTLEQLVALGDQAAKEDNFNFAHTILTLVLYQRWRIDPPKSEDILPFIQNIDKRIDARWSATLAMVLYKFVGGWNPDAINHYFEFLLTNAKKAEVSIAKQFYLQQSSLAFQSVLEQKINRKEADITGKEEWIQQLDRTIADTIAFLEKTVQTTGVETDEQRGLFNSFLHELSNYYLLCHPFVQKSEPTCSPAIFPAIYQKTNKIVLTMKNMLTQEQPFHKIDHVFQGLVNKMRLPHEIDGTFLDTLSENKRFQKEDIQTQISFLKQMYNELVNSTR